MPKRIVPLTDTIIRTTKPADKPLKLFDGGGLFLLVTPTGGKLWNLKYRFEGKENIWSTFLAETVYIDQREERGCSCFIDLTSSHVG